MYKDKLTVMLEIMKDVTVEAIKEEWIKKETIDIVKETTNLYMQIVLACLFGKDKRSPMLK